MKRFLPLLLSTPFLFSSCADCVQGTGDVVDNERTLAQFEEIEIETSVDVIIHQDKNLDQPTIKIEGPQNIIDIITTEVSGNTLTVDADQCFMTAGGIKAHVYLMNLKEITVSGSGSLASNGKIKGEDLELNIDGSGEVDLKLKYESVDTDITGSGDVALKGNVQEHDAVINGSGDILAAGLKTIETELEINGSGSCEVHATESLDIKVNGSGDVKYKGNPQHLNQQIHGSGGVSTIK